MFGFRKRAVDLDIPTVPLTVSMALAEMSTIPASPERLVRNYAESTSRTIRVAPDSHANSGWLERLPDEDVIHTPGQIRGPTAQEACLHQLGHLMIGHDACLMGHAELLGDDRLQELDAAMFAGLIMERYREVRRATGSSHPSSGKVTTAYVLGLLDDRWPRNLRHVS